MREFDNQILKKVFCNKCGREMPVENGMLRAGCFGADQIFGYFSRKDGDHHKWDLCEQCYDELVGTFRIPPSKKEETELI